MKRLISALFLCAVGLSAAVQTPEQYFGFRIGSDKKLVRWDKIVEYMQDVANGTDRVQVPQSRPHHERAIRSSCSRSAPPRT